MARTTGSTWWQGNGPALVVACASTAIALAGLFIALRADSRESNAAKREFLVSARLMTLPPSRRDRVAAFTCRPAAVLVSVTNVGQRPLTVVGARLFGTERNDVRRPVSFALPRPAVQDRRGLPFAWESIPLGRPSGLPIRLEDGAYAEFIFLTRTLPSDDNWSSVAVEDAAGTRVRAALPPRSRLPRESLSPMEKAICRAQNDSGGAF